MRSTNRISVREARNEDHLGVPGVNARIILKLIRRNRV
jgi:hypothetical protein